MEEGKESTRKNGKRMRGVWPNVLGEVGRVNVKASAVNQVGKKLKFPQLGHTINIRLAERCLVGANVVRQVERDTIQCVGVTGIIVANELCGNSTRTQVERKMVVSASVSRASRAENF